MADRIRTIQCHAAPGAEAARLLVEAIGGQGGAIRLAVAGGSAAPVLGAVRRNLGPKLWKQVRFTWVDERCVPFASPDSNRGAAYRDGHLDLLDPPERELPLYLDGETPEEACSRVETTFRTEFQGSLDVLLLGMGEDGHIASLFPGRVWDEAAVFPVLDSPKPPAARITLGLPVLAQASLAVLLAMGKTKLEALQRLAKGDPALPATLLHHLRVITDQSLFPSEKDA